ncbi:conserved Plasmodium protein, unknown function [Plasmodium gallinaceum]|uniref:Uncharacterized protein n=1 Tax=Plasmodium gallinaceum TaxID=5849 RepID=A0A1J1H3U0_PLAGA|nr:conserved Plasmodium protein, unknown function [Plasmodium gallinaceum]CRG98151.1 conserved Plasmodium protein, unknown function [Plasmodium gallinaceum]
MKEHENLERLKKKLNPFFIIFRKDEENELKKYSKKNYFINIIKNCKTSSNHSTDIETNKSNILMINKINNNTMRLFNIFNKYNGKDTLEKRKDFINRNMIKNKEFKYSYNNFLAQTYIYSKYFQNVLNKNVLTNTTNNEKDIDELENEYIIVNKVYTIIQEDTSTFIYIY